MTFRQWFYEMWYLHTDEIISVTGKLPSYSAAVYFQQNKWWLRRQYKEDPDVSLARGRSKVPVDE